jgi:trans-aconitate methyltransferase
LVRQVAPQPRDVILDLGCSTGDMTVALKQDCPAASVYGIESDSDLLTKAEIKARDKDLPIHFFSTCAQNTADNIRPNKLVLNLVMHRVALAGRRSAVRRAFAALAGGGKIHVADRGPQHSASMRVAAPQAISLFELMMDAGFEDICENAVIATPMGPIALYSAVRPRIRV